MATKPAGVTTWLVATAIIIATFVIVYVIDLSKNVCSNEQLISFYKQHQDTQIEKLPSLLDGLDQLSKWKDSLNDPIAVFTAIIAIFTVGLCFGTYQLASDTKESSERSQRAYVGVGFPFTITDLGVGRIRVSFNIVNSGQTPAYKMSCRGLIKICPYPLPDGFEFPQMLELETSESVLNPKDVFGGHAETGNPVSQADIDRMTNTSTRAYVFAIITYEDAFGKQRETKMCMSATLNPFDSRNRELHFVHARKHNTST